MFFDRVKFSVTGTPGTGSVTVDAEILKWRTPAQASMPNNNRGSFLFEDGTAWELCEDCVYATSGTTLTRGTRLSSSTGSAISLSSSTVVTMVPTLRDIVNMESVDVASAGTCDIGAIGSHYANVTGTTGITSFGTSRVGLHRWIKFAAALTLTHNGTSLILPGAANIVTAAGDNAFAVSLGSGNWRVLFYQRADGTSVVSSSVSGGALVTSTASSFALAAGDPRSQRIAFTVMAQSVTLPDATDYTDDEMGGPLFSFHNAGSFEFGVRRDDGTLLCVIASQGSVDIYLDDNATAAGTWHFVSQSHQALRGALTTLEHLLATTYTGVASAATKAISLTDTLSIHFFTSATTTYIVAVDHSTYPATVGTPVSLDTITGNFWGVATSSTTAQMMWMNSTTFYTAVVSVSGTAVSVGTPASSVTTPLSTGTDVTPYGQQTFALVGNYVLCGYRNSSNLMAAIAVYFSGTSSYISSPQTWGAAIANTLMLAAYELTSTTGILFGIDDSGTPTVPVSITAVVATVSGTTSPVVTLGTPATLDDVLGSVSNRFPVVKHSATLFTAVYAANSTLYPTAVGITVSGTTVTFGTPVTVESVAFGGTGFVVTGSQGTASPMRGNQNFPPVFVLDSTRALFSYCQAASTSTRAVVLTNTSGTITLGTITFGIAPADGANTLSNFFSDDDSLMIMCNTTNVQGYYGAVLSGDDILYGGQINNPELIMYSTPTNTDSAAMIAVDRSFMLLKLSFETYGVFRCVAGMPSYHGMFSIPFASSNNEKLAALPDNRIAFSGSAALGRYNATGIATSQAVLKVVEVPTL